MNHHETESMSFFNNWDYKEIVKHQNINSIVTWERRCFVKKWSWNILFNFSCQQFIKQSQWAWKVWTVQATQRAQVTQKAQATQTTQTTKAALDLWKNLINSWVFSKGFHDSLELFLKYLKEFWMGS